MGELAAKWYFSVEIICKNCMILPSTVTVNIMVGLCSFRLAFEEFAKWESIRRTEIYEYAISLGKQQKSSSASMSLPSFQLYKFLYACKLAEYGLIAQVSQKHCHYKLS